MANQVALPVLTHPGDDVILNRESHAVWHETGASAANSGVQFTAVGAKGIFTLDGFLEAIKPRGHVIYPPTTLVEIDNTHNRAGGVIFPDSVCTHPTHHSGSDTPFQPTWLSYAAEPKR